MTTKKPNQKKVPNLRRWLVPHLRRLSIKWPPRTKLYKAGRRELILYNKDGSESKRRVFEHQCNNCKEWFRAKNIHMDHILPVVDVEEIAKTEEEFISKFIISLFCYEDNWQKLCTTCHDVKTREENKIRNLNKKIDK